MEIKYKNPNRSFSDLQIGDTFMYLSYLYVKCNPASNNAYNSFNLTTNTVAFIRNTDEISPCKATIIIE